MYAEHDELRLYEHEDNSNNHDGLLRWHTGAFQSWLVVKLQGNGMAAHSDTGQLYELNKPVFQFASGNPWYLGVNRVIDPYNGPDAVNTRIGKGLCQVCVSWAKAQDLGPPNKNWYEKAKSKLKLNSSTMLSPSIILCSVSIAVNFWIMGNK